MVPKFDGTERLTEEDTEEKYPDTELHKDDVSREQEEEKKINISNFEETRQKISQEPSRQEQHRDGAPIVIVVAVGTMKDLPEALKKIEETLNMGSARHSIVVPVQNEEEEASKIVGKEISGTCNELEDVLLGNSTKEERKRMAEAVIDFTSAITSDIIGKDMPDTQGLAQAFDSALTVLIRVPVAEQNAVQLIESFLKLAVFSMSVIHLSKKCLENASATQIAWMVFTVGSVMFKIADKHGLYKRLQDNGGMSGLCTRICCHIRQLVSGNTATDGNNAVSIPWPSKNTIVLFGSLTVFVASCTYFAYKYR